MKVYLIARCEGHEKPSNFKKRPIWFRAHDFEYCSWSDAPYWTKLVEESEVDELTEEIESWQDWFAWTKPAPEPAAEVEAPIPTFSPDIQSALHADLDILWKLPGWFTISYTHKKEMVETLIKKYKRAEDTNSFCSQCGVRPPDAPESECRKCLGLSIITWKK